MALIKCPECGKDVSDTIESCIHCGFALKKEESTSLETNENSSDNKNTMPSNNQDVADSEAPGCFKVILIGAVLLFILFLIPIVFSSIINTSSSTSSVSTTHSAISIDLNTIHKDFVSNKLTARETYEGARYVSDTTAIIDDINEDYITVTIPTNYQSEYERFYVKLYYKNSELDYVRELKKYDFVFFEGTLTSLDSEIWMTFKDVVFSK